jgi:hypothetical protein
MSEFIKLKPKDSSLSVGSAALAAEGGGELLDALEFAAVVPLSNATARCLASIRAELLAILLEKK